MMKVHAHYKYMAYKMHMFKHRTSTKINTRRKINNMFDIMVLAGASNSTVLTGLQVNNEAHA